MVGAQLCVLSCVHLRPSERAMLTATQDAGRRMSNRRMQPDYLNKKTIVLGKDNLEVLLMQMEHDLILDAGIFLAHALLLEDSERMNSLSCTHSINKFPLTARSLPMMGVPQNATPISAKGKTPCGGSLILLGKPRNEES